MSPGELADYLSIPVGSIYQWRYRGGGPPGIKVGRHLRYRVRDVESWLDAAKADRPPHGPSA